MLYILLFPNAVFALPVVLLINASNPTAVLYIPEVFAYKVDTPIAVL